MSRHLYFWFGKNYNSGAKSTNFSSISDDFKTLEKDIFLLGIHDFLFWSNEFVNPDNFESKFVILKAAETKEERIIHKSSQEQTEIKKGKLMKMIQS